MGEIVSGWGSTQGIPWPVMPEQPTHILKAPALLYLAVRFANICISFPCEFCHYVEISFFKQDAKKPKKPTKFIVLAVFTSKK